MTDPHLMLVDGNNIAYRNYHATATSGLCDRKGRPSGALYGTIVSLRAYVREFLPTHLLWCFDDGGSDFRSALRSDYKGHRKLAAVGAHQPNPREEIPPQIDAIREFLSLAGISHTSERGVEADDIIATATLRWKGEMPVTIVSGDHDLLQLLDDASGVRVVRPGNAHAGRSGGMGLRSVARQQLGHVYTEETAREKYGVRVDQLAEMWSLMGDTSDNLVGIPGVGPKTAAKWIVKHGSLDGALHNEEKAEGYLQQCRENYRMIHLSGRLASLDVPLGDTKIAPKDLGPIVDWLLDWDMFSVAESVVEDGLWPLDVE